MQHPFSSRLTWGLHGLEAVLDLEAHECLQAVLVKSTEVLLDTCITRCVIVFRETKNEKDVRRGSGTFRETKSLVPHRNAALCLNFL